MTSNKTIDKAVPTSGHSPMYVMHKYFARKQEDVIREYIKNYSNSGEIILDPFCGSGVMIGESLKLGRKVIGVDINPVAIFITRNTISSLSEEKILVEFRRIETEIAQDIHQLYQTICRECGKIVKSICFTWKNTELSDVRYDCPSHGKKISPVNRNDLQFYAKINNKETPEYFDKGKCRFWYPTNKLYYSDGTPFLKKERFNSIDEIFTKRNLVALAKLYNRITKIEDTDLQEAFKFAFSSLTHLASKMTPVRPSRPYSSAWVQQSYWYCPHNMESNVWLLFERAILGRQGLMKAKKDIISKFKDKKESQNFKQLIDNKNKFEYMLIHDSVIKLETIPPETIDYVITDPPYGHSIQYGELLFMWGSWLQLIDNFDEIAKEEIISNPRQQKDDTVYENMLTEAFKKIYQLLKADRYCTVTFHNPSLKYRNILFRSVLQAGFEFENIVYQPAARASAKSLLQPFGSQRGDYFFRFKKPKRKREMPYKPLKKEDLEKLIIDITKRILIEKGEPTLYSDIQNSLDPLLYKELRDSGLLMEFNPINVEKTLSKYLGDVFQIVDFKMGKLGEKTLIGKGWWLINPPS
jgi:adenine-specific DNA methylase